MGFRADFENDPNIGGRYSALSFVGIAPSATAGYDINLLLDRALGAMHANDRSVDPRTAPGVRFGAAIGGLARNGRDKLTIVTHPAVKAFGAWAEQLIAESTGKMGKGIVPIEGEALGVPDDYGDDRVFVYVGANLPGPAAEYRRQAARARSGRPSGDPPRHERRLRCRRTVLPLGDRSRSGGRDPGHRCLRSAQRSGI